MRLATRLAALLLAVTVAACTTQTIQNVSNASVVSPSGKQLTADQVRTAIVRAGEPLGWVMRDSGPGKLSATLLLRTHKAEIDIAYSPSSYSIVYRSSLGLDANGDRIHRAYNGWITNLNRRIDAQLAAS